MLERLRSKRLAPTVRQVIELHHALSNVNGW